MIHLHVHSNYSFLAGTLSIENLIENALRNDVSIMGLTDTNNVSGMTEFYTKAGSAGIKPIVGAEVKYGQDIAVLLARNWDGYERICDIVTRTAEVEPPSRIEYEAESKENASRDEGLPSSKKLVDLLKDRIDENVIVLSDTISLIVELSDCCPKHNLFAELSKANQGNWGRIIDCAKQSNIRIVATNNVFFGDPRGKILHSILRAISRNKTIGTLNETEVAGETQYLCSSAQMERWFSGIPEALRNQRIIAEICNVDFDFSTSKFTSYEKLKANKKLTLLKNLVESGFADRYHKPREIHKERIRKELEIIETMGFVDYFLVAWDIVQYATRKNYPYLGRGSGANSIVAYCLKITNVDPIEHDLFFERFLNPERSSPPDFDIDFSWRHRDDVINYVLEKYDPEYTAMIGTISTFNPRGALREVGKALGFSSAEIKHITSLLPGYGSEKDLTDPKSLLRKYAGIVLSSPYGIEWVNIAKKILDFPNHYGIHAGGIILAPEKITRYTATQVTPKGISITQQDMYSLDDWRLEKLDILSTRGLGTFQDTMKAVEIRTGKTPLINDYKLACEDPATKSAIRSGKTIGCFYIESPAMIQLLKKLQADSFEMLTAASSIIRPGVAQSGMMQAFIERFHDPSKIKPPHPKMLELLHSTFGIMVYQEDVIKVAHYIGKLSLGEADVLRRAMSGKMRSRDAFRCLKEKFHTGCMEEGISEEAAAEIWRQIESFAGYSFCKAHSASYAVLSFQEAYLKAHYPAFFLCSVLNNQGGYYKPEVYIQEAKRLGIIILLPSVNVSDELHTCPDDNTIQLGFLNIKGLSGKSVGSILQERNRNGIYRDFDDFIHRCSVTYEDACILIRCGACDSFEEKRTALLVRAKLLIKRKNEPEILYSRPGFEDDLRKLRAYSPEQIAQIELDTFSFTVSTHVLSHFEKEIAGAVKARDLQCNVGKNVYVAGWLIAAKLSRTKKGERMMFMNIDDSTGVIDVVLFPKCYDKYAHILHTAGPYKIHGRVTQEYGVLNIVADKIEIITRK